jgi:hypothetical protein
MGNESLEKLKEGMSGKMALKSDEEREFELAQRRAGVYAKSKECVPVNYQNNLPDCIIAIEMAKRMGQGVLQTMQSLYSVHGSPSWKSDFVIGKINNSKLFKGTLKFRFEGKGRDRSCTAHAVDARDGETCEVKVDWQTVSSEGWDKKPGTKWKLDAPAMTDQMFRYRSGAWFARAYCPEVLMGLPTADEIEDSVIEVTEVSANNFEPLSSDPPLEEDPLSSFPLYDKEQPEEEQRIYDMTKPNEPKKRKRRSKKSSSPSGEGAPPKNSSPTETIEEGGAGNNMKEGSLTEEQTRHVEIIAENYGFNDELLDELAKTRFSAVKKEGQMHRWHNVMQKDLPFFLTAISEAGDKN